VLTTYKFKLKPNKSQKHQLETDQRNCTYVKNRFIGDREYTYESHHILGNYCRLYDKRLFLVAATSCQLEGRYIESGLKCSVNRNVTLGDPWKTGKTNRRRSDKSGKKEPSVKRSAYDMQSSYLPNLKKLKPELKQTSAGALQNSVKQVDIAYQNFFKGKSKYPNYKKTRETGIYYPDSETKLDTVNHKVYLPKVGWVSFHNSRTFWNGMSFSKFTVTLDVDQWYVSILVKDESIPEPKQLEPESIETIVGGDKGINKLLSVSGKTQFANPRFLQSEERRLRIRQRRLSRRKKGSNNRKKAAKNVASLHRKIRHQRTDYQWKVAKSFVGMADANAVENLNVSAMKKRCKPKKDENGHYEKNGQSAKRRLNQAISDASWFALDTKIEQQSKKQGKLHIKVEPRHTSQQCPECKHISKSNRKAEKFICTECGYHDDADNNAGRNIAAKAIETAKLNKQKIRVVSSEFTPKILLRRNHQHRLMSLGIGNKNQTEILSNTEVKKPGVWTQLSLDFGL
jgi:putative transposase